MTPKIILLNDLKTPQKWRLAFPRPLKMLFHSSFHTSGAYSYDQTLTGTHHFGRCSQTLGKPILSLVCFQYSMCNSFKFISKKRSCTDSFLPSTTTDTLSFFPRHVLEYHLTGLVECYHSVYKIYCKLFAVFASGSGNNPISFSQISCFSDRNILSHQTPEVFFWFSSFVEQVLRFLSFIFL